MDSKDRRLKYIELPRIFSAMANEIEISSKQSQAACVKLAKHLTKEHPKTPIEFERHEYLKEFVVKTAKNNENVILILEAIRAIILEVGQDYSDLAKTANLTQTIAIQSQEIQLQMQRNDELLKLYNESRTSKA